MNLRKQNFKMNVQMLIVSVVAITFLINFYSTAYSYIVEPYLSSQSLSKIPTETILLMLDECDVARLHEADYQKELQDEFVKLGYTLIAAKDSELIIGSPDDGIVSVMQQLKADGGGRHDFSMIFETSSLKAVSKVKGAEGSTYLLTAIQLSPNFLISFEIDYRNPTSVVYIFFIIEVFLLICAVLLAGMYFSRRNNSIVLKPLRLLRNAASKVHRGNYDARIEYEGISEFEEVCSAFNEMQAEIKANITQMESYEKGRTEMIAGISHDLRTPLTSIKGYIKGIKDGVANTPEKQQKYIDTIYEQSEKMSRLLDRLFMLSNLETKSVPFTFENIKIKPHMEKFYEYVADDMEHAGGSVTFASDCSDDAEIRADTVQINRVFDNLVANSRLYSGVPDPVIALSLKETENEIIIEFHDNGRGVPEENLSKLFDSFYRSDDARQSHGNGLGLTIAKQIVERHGGAISATNSGGLLITIRLPKLPRGEGQK
ncbi:MAG: HAMP domain-containing histidine kinase [Oscillospiraceae bacterium]|nr:HAMP domain-containing histidine kinase [Oscillospiraceae bacterium]